LLRRLEEEAARQGAARTGLHVVADNAAALALYEKRGYHVVSMRMEKRLPTSP
jgi:ribosomal protein S18 acetylase RimI-like enzyme